MKALMLIALFVFSLSASDKLFLMTLSSHSGDKEYNNNNFGIGYEHTLDNGFGMQVAVYKNSYYDISTLTGIHYEKELLLDIKVGISTSYATGYNTPKIIPLTSIQYKYIRISTSYLFSKAMNKVSVTNIQLVYQF